MPYWTIKVYITPEGKNEIEEWLIGHGAKVRAKAHAIIRHLEISREWRGPYFDTFAGHDKLHEIRIRGAGNIQHRLIGCYGPDPKDFTILIGAIERNKKYTPRSALEFAEKRMEIVLKDGRYANEYWEALEKIN